MTYSVTIVVLAGIYGKGFVVVPSCAVLVLHTAIVSCVVRVGAVFCYGEPARSRWCSHGASFTYTTATAAAAARVRYLASILTKEISNLMIRSV